MKIILSILFFISSLAFGADRVIINPENNGNLKIKANVAGTATDVISIIGSTGKAEVNIKADGCSAGTVCSGTYTPTLFNTSNVAASTAFVLSYIRVGSVVTVSGEVDIDPTSATTSSELGISLPIASNLAGATQLGGIASGGDPAGSTLMAAAKILGDPTNDRAKVSWVSSTDVGNRAWAVHFTYLIQ